jgi:dUTP pyrophosphatase
MIKLHQGNPDDQAVIRELLKYGNRVAQALIVQLPKITWSEVYELPSTERGLGGFGSTGSS